MTTNDIQITNLDFYFIREVREGIYEIVYAKDIREDEDTKADVLYDYNEVAFRTIDSCDHRLVISFDDILFKGLTL